MWLLCPDTEATMRNLKLLQSLRSSELQAPGCPQCVAVRADVGSLLVASHSSITEFDPRTGQVRWAEPLVTRASCSTSSRWSVFYHQEAQSSFRVLSPGGLSSLVCGQDRTNQTTSRTNQDCILTENNNLRVSLYQKSRVCPVRDGDQT